MMEGVGEKQRGNHPVSFSPIKMDKKIRRGKPLKLSSHI